MSSPVSSPPRPSKLMTYSGRQKRKRTLANDASGQSESEDMSDTETKDKRPNMVASAGAKKIATSTKTSSSSVGPKKVEIHLPGPSPKKRVRNDAESPTLAKTPSGKVMRPNHRRISSASSRPSPIGRPLSNISPSFTGDPLSLLRSQGTPDDDSSSIAESTVGTRIRRTEEERIRLFKDHPDCGEMEPYRVLCKRCDKWVNLGRKQTYTVRPWDTHRDRCDRDTHLAAVDVDDDVTSVTPSITEPSIRRTEVERQELLESDPRAEQVLPNEVLCKKCQRWIKLAAKQRYALGNWNAHLQRCCGSIPSIRVASAERKLKIVNDSQVRTFTSRSIECAKCGVSVALDGEYSLTNWDHHKKHCPTTTSTPHIDLSKLKSSSICSNSLAPSPLSVQSSVRPRGSPSATSDDTLIASDASPGQKQLGKRAREDDGEEERPSNRSRTENYTAPEEAPGPWGWFLFPLKTFISGFQEGIRSSAA